jgi:hypothetical protein
MEGAVRRSGHRSPRRRPRLPEQRPCHQDADPEFRRNARAASYVFPWRSDRNVARGGRLSHDPRKDLKSLRTSSTGGEEAREVGSGPSGVDTALGPGIVRYPRTGGERP